MTDWTADRIRRLTTLWAEGKTCSYIAAELGVTRNAVIGKAHRLGLSTRPSPLKNHDHYAGAMSEYWHRRRNGKPPTPKTIKRNNARKGVVMTAVRTAKAHLPTNGSVRVKTSTIPAPMPAAPKRALPGVRACQWPEGDPKQPGFHFCGATPVVPGKPYCLEHCKVAYRTPAQVEAERAEREAA